MAAPADNQTHPAETVHHGRQITRIARDFMKLANLDTVSVADVGCYKRPIHSFVSKNFEISRFLGVDEDADAVSWLREQGLDGADFAEYATQPAFDFTFLLEVVEHIPETQDTEFLRTVLRQTKVAAFFTTPNFEGWDARGRAELVARPAISEMRYVPDHLKVFRPTSPNPHHHKRVMTIEWMAKDVEAVLPDGWKYHVFKAWPWTLADHSTGTSFKHCFKVFTVIWNPAAFEGDMMQYLETTHLAPHPD